ncbi:MAG TPA: hypothetical protein VGN49_06980 [Micrococcaceae bacterium]|nr:hypothetical protein [Micrococcaceae bacterium]
MAKRTRNKENNASPELLPIGTPWPRLRPRQRLTLVDVHGTRVVGTLDAITEDCSTLWIQLDDGLGRQLIHSLDGYELEAFGDPA